MKELKAVEILTLMQRVDNVSTRQMQKEINEALAELQELTQEKSREGCTHNYKIINRDMDRGERLEDLSPDECYRCSRNHHDHYTPKG